MTAYELIISIDKEILKSLSKHKLTRKSIFRDIDIYEFYIKECQYNSKLKARSNVAGKFGISEETVSKTIQRLRCNI